MGQCRPVRTVPTPAPGGGVRCMYAVYLPYRPSEKREIEGNGEGGWRIGT